MNRESAMLPPVANTIAEVRTATEQAWRAGKSVGFVPTMGALHAGHAALIRAARAETDFTVVSVFVNPTQFGPNEDFTRYPRTFDADRELCGAVGTDLIFAPAREEMYPPDSRTFVEVTGLEDVLCGRSRPGHFRGVATVVAKLFNIVQPHVAFFGQKDAQQVAIIRRMVADLNLPVVVRVVPTVREPDGLAMSSRNRYLDPTQRLNATCLVRALRKADALVAGGERSVPAIERAMADLIGATPGALLDYAEIRDLEALEPVATLHRPALAALAVYFGTTRLIDNTILSPGEPGRGT
jgi:pantoate--beta-alanine ligase